MLTLRAIALYLAVTITLILWTIVLFIAWPFGRGPTLAVERSWSRLVTHLARWICGIRFRIEGLENLPNRPVIFFSKHQSAWETLVMPSLLPANCFVCKKSLLNIPVFGWAMRITHHIPIDRSQGVQALKSVIKEGKDRLSKGLSIVIFPEGTRVPPLANPTFHKSGSALARATHAPIVPIAHNAGQCWRRNSFLKTPGLITIVIGQPIPTEGRSVEEINQDAYQWITTTMARLESPAFLAAR